MLLSNKDKEFIAEWTAELIASSEQTGRRYVPDASAENLYGTDDTPFVLDCGQPAGSLDNDADSATQPLSQEPGIDTQEGGEAFPFEFVETPVEVLTSKKADAVISVLPDQEINDGDRIEFEGIEYKVLTCKTMNIFGVVSHKVVTVARRFNES